MQELIARTRELVSSIADENELTQAVAQVLREALEGGLAIPAGATVPDPERYVMYPLHVEPDGSFSIASAVWDVGQKTPVHGHETWGVVGIFSGQEHEVAYQKPRTSDIPLVPLTEHVWGPNQVTVCCTTDDDVHRVSCHGGEPVVGIHIYGADIGTLERRSYDPDSGRVSWFVSRWADLPASNDSEAG